MAIRPSKDPATTPGDPAWRIATQLAERKIVGFLEWNLASGRIYCSLGAYRILGLEPGVAVDIDKFDSLTHPRDRLDKASLLQNIDAGLFDRRQMRIVRSHGEMRRVCLRCCSVYSPDGDLVKLLGVLIDETDQARERFDLPTNKASPPVLGGVTSISGARDSLASAQDVKTPAATVVLANAQLTGAHIRGARGFLGWTALELATNAHVSLSTVRRIEDSVSVPTVRDRAMAAIRSSLENGGILFWRLPDGQIAICLKDMK